MSAPDSPHSTGSDDLQRWMALRQTVTPEPMSNVPHVHNVELPRPTVTPEPTMPLVASADACVRGVDSEPSEAWDPSAATSSELRPEKVVKERHPGGTPEQAALRGKPRRWRSFSSSAPAVDIPENQLARKSHQRSSGPVVEPAHHGPPSPMRKHADKKPMLPTPKKRPATSQSSRHTLARRDDSEATRRDEFEALLDSVVENPPLQALQLPSPSSTTAYHHTAPSPVATSESKSFRSMRSMRSLKSFASMRNQKQTGVTVRMQRQQVKSRGSQGSNWDLDSLFSTADNNGTHVYSLFGTSPRSPAVDSPPPMSLSEAQRSDESTSRSMTRSLKSCVSLASMRNLKSGMACRQNSKVEARELAQPFSASALVVQAFIHWRKSAGAVSGLIRIFRAARCIQSAWRCRTARRGMRYLLRAIAGCSERRLLKEMHEGKDLVRGLYWSPTERLRLVMRLQYAARAFLERLKYIRMRNGLKKLQRQFRAMKARRQLLACLLPGLSARRIQRCAHGFFARRRRAETKRCLEEAHAARVTYERRFDSSAVAIQCAWRSVQSRTCMKELAVELESRIERRTAAEGQVCSLSTLAFETIEKTLRMYTARGLAIRHRMAVKQYNDQRQAREKLLDWAVLAVQQHARVILSACVVCRRKYHMAHLHCVRAIQAVWRGHRTRVAVRGVSAQVESAEDTRVHVEKEKDAAMQELMKRYIVRLQAIWRGKKGREEAVRRRRPQRQKKLEFLERQHMHLQDEYLMWRAGIPVIQRLARVKQAAEAAHKAYNVRLSEYTARIVRERHWSAACVQYRFRLWLTWRNRYIWQAMRLQLWWRVQNKLRHRRRRRAAAIIVRSMRIGTRMLYERRVGNLIGFWWRCRARRYAKQHQIRRWIHTIELVKHGAAVTIQVRWRIGAYRRVEGKARAQIEGKWNEGFAAIARLEQLAHGQVPSGCGVDLKLLPKALLNAYLGKVAAMWRDEECARAHLTRSLQKGVRLFASAQSDMRISRQQKSHVVRLVHTLRKCRVPAGKDVDVDSLVWHRHRLPVGPCKEKKFSQSATAPRPPARPRSKTPGRRHGKLRSGKDAQRRPQVPPDIVFEL
eukprot:TRINITY_DN29716_c0_g1_i1.p1 TRINITY_DN29716_c0_g1~~TRINITY_DN29716_c0_g1_i1.p1  ORF type:complete len:1087 (+),score=92.30 TRINITY_DN29716_c0_g1_i1:165-3425(+)